MSSTELTFHSFPKLPAEIRIQIWKLTVQDAPGREVRLRSDEWKPSAPSRSLTRMTSTAEIPPLLHTCHLSRMFARERWKLGMTILPTDEKMVYIDFTTDMIVFPDEYLLSLWSAAGDRDEVSRAKDANNVWMDWCTYSDLEGTVEHLRHISLPYFLPPWQ